MYVLTFLRLYVTAVQQNAVGGYNGEMPQLSDMQHGADRHGRSAQVWLIPLLLCLMFLAGGFVFVST
jgi:hypothetical protein